MLNESAALTSRFCASRTNLLSSSRLRLMRSLLRFSMIGLDHWKEYEKIRKEKKRERTMKHFSCFPSGLISGSQFRIKWIDLQTARKILSIRKWLPWATTALPCVHLPRLPSLFWAFPVPFLLPNPRKRYTPWHSTCTRLIRPSALQSLNARMVPISRRRGVLIYRPPWESIRLCVPNRLPIIPIIFVYILWAPIGRISVFRPIDAKGTVRTVLAHWPSAWNTMPSQRETCDNLWWSPQRDLWGGNIVCYYFLDFKTTTYKSEAFRGYSLAKIYAIGWLSPLCSVTFIWASEESGWWVLYDFFSSRERPTGAWERQLPIGGSWVNNRVCLGHRSENFIMSLTESAVNKHWGCKWLRTCYALSPECGLFDGASALCSPKQ